MSTHGRDGQPVPPEQQEARESLDAETRRERDERGLSSESHMHPPRATVVHGDKLPAEALSKAESREPRGPVGTRQEVGSQADSQRHPPHVTQNDAGAPLQEGTGSDQDVAALPANASGTDSIPADEASREIDPESMYGARPAEDSNRPPGSHGG